MYTAIFFLLYNLITNLTTDMYSNQKIGLYKTKKIFSYSDCFCLKYYFLFNLLYCNLFVTSYFLTFQFMELINMVSDQFKVGQEIIPISINFLTISSSQRNFLTIKNHNCVENKLKDIAELNRYGMSIDREMT